jgi:uncharacterized OB-fold protein
MSEMSGAFPKPEREYREHLAAGRFMLQRSRSSGKFIFPPRVAEPVTGAVDLEWVAASGRGTVHAVTVVPRKAPEPAHVIVLVDLHEGPRMLSVVRGPSPGAVAIGDTLLARIEAAEGGPLLVFVPSGAMA